MLAYSYPLLGVFWSMLWFFLFIVWIWLLIVIFADIFRSHDIGGFAKALWVIFIIILPFLGVFVYLIARGGKMQEHAVQQAKDQDQAMRAYIQDVNATSGGGTADQLAKLNDLKNQGVLTDAEFEAQKAKLLAPGSRPHGRPRPNGRGRAGDRRCEPWTRRLPHRDRPDPDHRRRARQPRRGVAGISPLRSARHAGERRGPRFPAPPMGRSSRGRTAPTPSPCSRSRGPPGCPSWSRSVTGACWTRPSPSTGAPPW